MHRKYLFPISLSLSMNAGFAESNICSDLARTLVDTSHSFSQEEQQAIGKAAFCSESYTGDSSASSAAIKASFADYFSGSASATTQQIQVKQSQECGSQYGNYWRNNIQSQSAKGASQATLAVINNCVTLTNSGMTPSITMTPSGGLFTLTLRWQPSVPSNLQIYQAGPSNLEGYHCMAQSGPTNNRAVKAVSSIQDTRTVLASSESYLLTCDRPSVSVTLDGETNTCYKEGIIVVASNGPSASLVMAQSCTPSMPGLRAATIEKHLKEIDEKEKTDKAKLDAAIIDVQNQLIKKTDNIENEFKKIRSKISY